MKTNKYINGLAAAALAFGFASCSSDYLNDTPYHGIVSNDMICATSESAHQAAIGACQGMAGVWDYSLIYQFLGAGEPGLTTFYGEMPGSDSYSNFFLDVNPSWDIFYKMQDTMGKGNYVWDGKMWTWCYAIIAQCNEILETIDDYSEGDPKQRAFAKGEALTLRAHCYWRLLQAYAPRWEASDNGNCLSVVLRTSPKDPQDKALSPMIDVLDQMYADLDAAIVSYKEAGNFQRLVTYEPDLNVAYGVYARVAAMKNDWAKVKDMAHNARQGKTCSTPETLFAGFGSYVDKEWMWSCSFNPTDNNIYSNWSTCWAANGFYACTQSGTNRINIDLYNKIPETDARRNLWFTIDKIDVDAEEFYNSKNINNLNGDITFRAGRRAANAWIEDHNAPGYSGAYTPGDAGEESTAPVVCNGAQLKFFCSGMTGADGFSFPPFMRATEMYLLEAEACAMLGQSGEAQAIMNEINGKYDPAYACTKTGQELIDEIRTYTRIELWGEGFCWFNLKRWGMDLERRAWVAGDVNSGNLPGMIECNVGPNEANLWRYGIPQAETQYNTLVTYPYAGNGM